MLTAVREFFDRHIKPSTDEADPGQALHLATAALMIEMMRMDKDEHTAEREAIFAAMRTRFGLDTKQVAELIKLAEMEAKDPSDYYQFTSLINKRCSMQEKEAMIEHLWQIAYADGVLDAHEEYLVRRIAGLLGIPNRDFIAAKHRAREAAGTNIHIDVKTP